MLHSQNYNSQIMKLRMMKTKIKHLNKMLSNNRV